MINTIVTDFNFHFVKTVEINLSSNYKKFLMGSEADHCTIHTLLQQKEVDVTTPSTNP